MPERPVTLVFDKGNNAEDIIQDLGESPYHIVGSLVPTQHKDLLTIARTKFKLHAFYCVVAFLRTGSSAGRSRREVVLRASMSPMRAA